MKKLLLSFLFLLHTSFGFSQLVESFENTTGITGPLPATWTLGSGNWTVFENNTPATVGTSQSWGINAFATGIQFDGTQCASVSREYIGAGNTSEDYLVTPAVFIPANGVIRFHTRMFTYGDQGTIYRIMVAPEFVSPSDFTAYTLVTQWTEDELIVPASNYNVWTEKVVDLSAYAGLGIGVYIAFVRVYTQTDANLNGDRWLIDNVGTLSPPVCVTGAFSNFSSPTTVDFSWATSFSSPVEVMILPCDQDPPTVTDNGVVVTGNFYQFTNLIPGTCYHTYIRGSCPGMTNNWQSVVISQNAGIRLIAFIDSNNNGIMDTDEEYFQNGSFAITRNNTSTYSIRTGLYTFRPYATTDVYDFGYQLDSYYSSCFTIGNFNYDDIPAPQQTQNLYFPVIPITSCFDNKVVLSPTNLPRPGLSNYDYITIMTNGIDAPTSGTLTYTKAPNIPIASVTPSSGIVFTPTGFTYNYSGLSLSNPINFTIVNSIPSIPTVNLGDVLTSSASISFAPADSNASNDTSSLTQTIIGSYDPNDINESHGPKIQFDQFSQNDYLDYTIRFQNTGNANAIRVRVDNVLDSRIDENSINMISARHDYIMVRRDNTVSWEFNNIQLPPASVNEDLSNGFITFRVKLKPGFAIGDIIPAAASIYFDSNPAIVTETFNTEFVQLLGNPTFGNESVSLYPNPTSDVVTITNNNSVEKISKITIYDFTGKRIYNLNDNMPNAISINVSHFAKGIYLVEILSESNSKITKKLILK